jgi:thioester reductase-like protein
MARAGSLLLTGSTGMAGREITRVLLTRTDVLLTLLLHDTGRTLSRPRLLRELFRLEATPALIRRVRLVRGDLTKVGLGLPGGEYAELAKSVDGIIHAAATTRFDLALAEARRVNVLATRHLIRFAKKCRNLTRFGLLSTVFVSGRRQGRILESERAHGAGFVNTYEQSKYEAEACLESSDLPYVIYRLSTLVGDSQTGFTSHFTTPHQALRVMHLGLASLVPGLPDYSVDLIPTDWAGATIVNDFLNEFQAGRVVHLVAGAARSYSLAQVIDESYDRLGELDPAWKGRHYPKPAIATQAAFQLLVRSAEQARDPLMIGVLGMLKYFTEQFSYPKEFDARSLNGANAAPDIREYYGRVVAYCLKTKWGRSA